MSVGAGSEPAPDLSVIVVTHNGRERALATLRSARAAVRETTVQWLVVDSGSTDGTPDAVALEFPDVELLRRANRGFAAGNNAALACARGRFVLLLNPDVDIPAGGLDRLVAALEHRPEIGLASVTQRGADGALQPSIRRFPTPARDLGEALFASRWPVLRTLQEPETRAERYHDERQVDWLVGAFLIARREALAEVGLMDERFFLYSEEIDWCYRFWQAGWPVVHLPLIEVIHHVGGRSTGDLVAQLSYSRMLFAAKHYGRLRRLGIRFALGLGHALRLAVLGPAALRSGAARERVAAERGGFAVILGLSGPPLATQEGTLAAPAESSRTLVA